MATTTEQRNNKQTTNNKQESVTLKPIYILSQPNRLPGIPQFLHPIVKHVIVFLVVAGHQRVNAGWGDDFNSIVRTARHLRLTHVNDVSKHDTTRGDLCRQQSIDIAGSTGTKKEQRKDVIEMNIEMMPNSKRQQNTHHHTPPHTTTHHHTTPVIVPGDTMFVIRQIVFLQRKPTFAVGP
jgi:hypothetical protein